MKPLLAKLLPELQLQTRDFLERFAEAELNPAILRVKIFDAAKQGHTSLRVKIPLHMNVQNSKAAKALMAWCEESGLAIAWEKRSGEVDGQVFSTFEPVISWV